MKSHTKGIVYLLLAAGLWSIGGLFIKLVPWPPLAVAGGRSAIAAFVLAMFLDWKNLKLTKLDIASAIFYALTVSLFVSATKLTTAANAIFLQYTAPVYVIGLAHYYLKERTTRADIFTVMAVILGMAMFFYEKVSFDGFWGNILAIISGVTFAIMTVLLRASKGVPMKAICLGNILAAVSLSPFVWQAPPLDFWGMIYLLVLGVFQLGFSYVFYARAVPHVPALQTVLVAMLEPVLNPLWVLLLLGEKPTFMAGLGGGVIILAVAFRSVFQPRP